MEGEENERGQKHETGYQINSSQLIQKISKKPRCSCGISERKQKLQEPHCPFLYFRSAEHRLHFPMLESSVSERVHQDAGELPSGWPQSQQHQAVPRQGVYRLCIHRSMDETEIRTFTVPLQPRRLSTISGCPECLHV